MKRLLLCVFLTAPALPAGAIELSLEENRAERGNIGYIDMKRLFVLFPETQRAKESFEDSVRQAEEQLNARKGDLLRLRAELGKLKTERAALAAAPAPEPPKPAPVIVPMVLAAPNPQLDALLASTFTLPGFLSSASTSTSIAVSTAIMPAPVVVSTVAAPSVVVSTPAAAAPAAALPSALQVLDDKIAQKTAELSRKETDFREYQAATEKSLLDLESRKSELLLGKIHKAVQEIARKEGVSVVVDKGSILYGHNAVDLTEKVLRHLKGT